MSLFQQNNIPLEFNLIGVNNDDLSEIKDLIVKNGGKVGRNREFPYIGFTAKNTSSIIAKPGLKLYDVQFIKDCISKSRIVDYRDYRLNETFPSDDCLMSHFLFGQCCIDRAENKSDQASTALTDKKVHINIKTEIEVTGSQTCSSIYATAQSNSQISSTHTCGDESCQSAPHIHCTHSQQKIESQPVVIPCSTVFQIQMYDKNSDKAVHDVDNCNESNDITVKTESQSDPLMAGIVKCERSSDEINESAIALRSPQEMSKIMSAGQKTGDNCSQSTATLSVKDSQSIANHTDEIKHIHKNLVLQFPPDGSTIANEQEDATCETRNQFNRKETSNMSTISPLLSLPEMTCTQSPESLQMMDCSPLDWISTSQSRGKSSTSGHSITEHISAPNGKRPNKDCIDRDEIDTFDANNELENTSDDSVEFISIVENKQTVHESGTEKHMIPNIVNLTKDRDKHSKQNKIVTDSNSKNPSVKSKKPNTSKFHKNDSDSSSIFASHSDSSDEQLPPTPKKKRTLYNTSAMTPGRLTHISQPPSTENQIDISMFPYEIGSSSDSDTDQVTVKNNSTGWYIKQSKNEVTHRSKSMREGKGKTDGTGKSIKKKKGGMERPLSYTSDSDSDNSDTTNVSLKTNGNKFVRPRIENKEDETKKSKSSRKNEQGNTTIISDTESDSSEPEQGKKTTGSNNSTANKRDVGDVGASTSGMQKHHSHHAEMKLNSSTKRKTPSAVTPMETRSMKSRKPFWVPASRALFSNYERRKMIDYLISEHRISQAKGLNVWKAMVQDGVLENRTAHSIHNHFMKTVLPNLNALNLEKDILDQFMELCRHKKPRNRKH